MDDAQKKKLAELSGKLGGNLASPGASSEMVRKAVALNPKLKGNMKTSDLLAEVEKATGQRPVGAAAPEAPKERPTDLLEAVSSTKERFVSEQERLIKEQARIQAELKNLVARSLDRVIEAVITIDPNMVSPRTLMVLEDEKQFLREIGFDVRKVVEKQKSRK